MVVENTMPLTWTSPPPDFDIDSFEDENILGTCARHDGGNPRSICFSEHAVGVNDEPLSAEARMKSAPTTVEPDVDDDVEMVLTWHEGDARAAIRTLLNDCSHLRKQLQVTETAMSTGFARGWRPSYNRD